MNCTPLIYCNRSYYIQRADYIMRELFFYLKAQSYFACLVRPDKSRWLVLPVLLPHRKYPLRVSPDILATELSQTVSSLYDPDIWCHKMSCKEQSVHQMLPVRRILSSVLNLNTSKGSQCGGSLSLQLDSCSSVDHIMMLNTYRNPAWAVMNAEPAPGLFSHGAKLGGASTQSGTLRR